MGDSLCVAAVARRLQQLGALTHGDRNATSASDALASSNLQTKCAPWQHQPAIAASSLTIQSQPWESRKH